MTNGTRSKLNAHGTEQMRFWARNATGASAFRAVDAETTEILLYDEIGFFGINARDFVTELNAIDTPKIDLRINSVGGEVFDGFAMLNALRRHSAQVTTYVDAVAASAASFIAMGGDRVLIARNARFMIHAPWSFVLGGAADMRSEADVLDEIADKIGLAYGRADFSDAELDEMMHGPDDHWFDAEASVARGLADEISEDTEGVSARVYDFSIFKNVPADFAGPPAERPAERVLERRLRAAGLSARLAKAAVRVVKENPSERDAGTDDEAAIRAADALLARLRAA